MSYVVFAWSLLAFINLILIGKDRLQKTIDDEAGFLSGSFVTVYIHAVMFLLSPLFFVVIIRDLIVEIKNGINDQVD